MSNTAKRGTAEMRYLLRDLSEDEKARMEEAFFVDDAKFEELELAEEELIDAYVRDYLSPEERRQFQAKLLRSPRLVQRVNFARVLTEKADSSLSSEAEDSFEPQFVVSPPEPKPRRSLWASLFPQQPAFATAFATAGVLLLIGGGILFYGWLRLRNESERLLSERAEVQRQKNELEKLSTEQRAKIEELTTELRQAHSQQADDQQRIRELELAKKSKESDQPILASFVSLVLKPGSLRGEGGGNKVTIRPDTPRIKLIVPLETNDYRSYSVVIENIDKGVSIPRPNLKPQRSKSSPQLVFQIPAQTGAYIMKVSGRTPLGDLVPVSDFEFSVTPK